MVNGSIRSTAWARHKPLHEWERFFITRPYRILIITIIRGSNKNLETNIVLKKTQCRNQCFSGFRFWFRFIATHPWSLRITSRVGNCHPVAVDDSFLPRPDLPTGYCFYGTRIDTAKWRMGPSDQATIGLEPGSGSGLNQKILWDEVMVTEKLQWVQHSLRFKWGIPAPKVNCNFSWRIIFWIMAFKFPIQNLPS